jgi:hypothetical protein
VFIWVMSNVGAACGSGGRLERVGW